MLREALVKMGREDLIGPGKAQLIPAWQPRGTGRNGEGRRGRGEPPPCARDGKSAPGPRRRR
jgi:hypothetical protein